MTATRTVLETLEAARKLITPEGAWTQGAFARDAHRVDVDWDSQSAVCWCSSGAMRVVTRDRGIRFSAISILRRVLGGSDMSIIEFNDTHTHAEVLAAFDAAIAKEREAQHA